MAGVAARTSGPLDAGEQAVFEELEGALYACLGLDAELESAARATSARRDDTVAAERIAAEFRRRGRAVRRCEVPEGGLAASGARVAGGSLES
jgi:hypothetical protein